MSTEWPIDVPMKLQSNEFVEGSATRVSDSQVNTVWRSKNNGQVVLEAHGFADGRAPRIERLDTVFWNITINGKPATESELAAALERGETKLEATPENRTLNIDWL